MSVFDAAGYGGSYDPYSADEDELADPVQLAATDKTLALHTDALEPVVLRRLADGIKHNRQLQALELAKTTLTGRAGLPLAPPPAFSPYDHATDDMGGLECYRKLESHDQLGRSTQPRDTHGLVALCSSLRCGSKVRLADLTSCAIGDAGAKLLSDALRSAETPPLREMRLGTNGIGDDGARALASAVRCNVHVAVLSLEGNAIGAAGAVALAGMLEVNGSLRELDMSHNRAGARGVAAIAAALPLARALVALRLPHNGAAQGGTQKAQRALEAALVQPLALRRLSLHGNGFGFETRAALQAALAAGPNDRLELTLKLKPSGGGKTLALAPDALSAYDGLHDESDTYREGPFVRPDKGFDR